MSLRPLAHLGFDGPIDAILELGIPLVVFVALWWWSARAERRRNAEPDRRAEDHAEARDREGRG
ncbi:MAG TPA: hypothetical protein VFC31_12890 [Candidatus Limnocylindria bacterium]|nr:hypothetical protein [Candidatus Limnocylindria bacterium]